MKRFSITLAFLLKKREQFSLFCLPCPHPDHEDEDVRESARLEAARLTRLIISHAARQQAAAAHGSGGRRGSRGKVLPFLLPFSYNAHSQPHRHEEVQDEEDESCCGDCS